jgi:dTDP-glucose 4,6-dehydratase
MKILITGSMGFIGSKLTPILKKKYETYALDQYISDDVNYYRADVSIMTELINIFDEHKFDLVIHMAAECGIENCEEHIQKSIQTNIVGTYNIINLCKKYNTKLVYFSTSEIYGEVEDGKMIEDDNISLLQPKNHYAMQKLFGEKMIIKELSEYIIIRPFMVYGVGEKLNKYRSVISKFIKICQMNGKLPVHKNSYRSWMHINDFTNAIELLIESKTNGIYNVGNDTEIIEIEELAKIIINKIGGGTTEILNSPSIRTPYKVGDFTKLTKLGFKPTIKISQGIDELISFVKK